jgi:MoaA/NifB/PqqE/SkfB family radical SAM enzyme
METQSTADIDRLGSLWLELTTKCNLSCDHCYADANPYQPLNQELQLEDWIDTLKEASTIGCRRVQFIGGEPTLYPGLGSLIESARSFGFNYVELFTNGTILNKKLKDILMRHQVSLAFSIYADRDDIHDSITRRNGSFKRTIAFITWAANSGLPVRAAIIEMEKNSAYIDRTREMLHQRGVRSIGVDRVRGVGRGCRENHKQSSLKELCGRCWQGKLCITSSGQIFPCVFSRFIPVGHIRQGLVTVMASAELRSFRQKLRLMHSSSEQICDPDLPEPPCNPDLPEPPQTRNVIKPTESEE